MEKRVVDYELVPFIDGPAAGQVGEIPVDQEANIWRCLDDGRYARYRRDAERALRFDGAVASSPAEVAEMLARSGTKTAMIHLEDDPPRRHRGQMGRLP